MNNIRGLWSLGKRRIETWLRWCRGSILVSWYPDSSELPVERRPLQIYSPSPHIGSSACSAHCSYLQCVSQVIWSDACYSWSCSHGYSSALISLFFGLFLGLRSESSPECCIRPTSLATLPGFPSVISLGLFRLIISDWFSDCWRLFLFILAEWSLEARQLVCLSQHFRLLGLRF